MTDCTDFSLGCIIYRLKITLEDPMSSTIQPGRKFDDAKAGDFVMTEVFNQDNSNLGFLSLSVIKQRTGSSPFLAFPKDECLLFLLEIGRAHV